MLRDISGKMGLSPLQSHRQRLQAMGLRRIEVSVLDRDVDLIRLLCRQLRAGPAANDSRHIILSVLARATTLD